MSNAKEVWYHVEYKRGSGMWSAHWEGSTLKEARIIKKRWTKDATKSVYRIRRVTAEVVE